jgi:hypothetical protein
MLTLPQAQDLTDIVIGIEFHEPFRPHLLLFLIQPSGSTTKILSHFADLGEFVAKGVIGGIQGGAGEHVSAVADHGRVTHDGGRRGEAGHGALAGDVLVGFFGVGESALGDDGGFGAGLSAA